MVVILQASPTLHGEVKGAEVPGHAHLIICVHQLKRQGGAGQGGVGGEKKEWNVYGVTLQYKTATRRTIPPNHNTSVPAEPLTCNWAATDSDTTVFLKPNRPAAIMRWTSRTGIGKDDWAEGEGQGEGEQSCQQEGAYTRTTPHPSPLSSLTATRSRSCLEIFVWTFLPLITMVTPLLATLSLQHSKVH